MKSARSFEALVLPHLDAALNLARWLVRDAHVAEDIVQESCLRAFRYFDSLRGDAVRPWLFGIVRNSCYSWLKQQRGGPVEVEFDEEVLERPEAGDSVQARDPGDLLDARRSSLRVDAAIRALAPPFREVIVLREMEGLTYEDIAQIAAIPIGTVMSRLARARAELRIALADVRKQI